MSLDAITKPISASRTVRVIKNLCWWMLGMFLLGGMTVNYITCNSLGILAPELKNSLNMTTEQYSWVAAFQLVYTLFQPVCGWLIDVIWPEDGLPDLCADMVGDLSVACHGR